MGHPEPRATRRADEQPCPSLLGDDAEVEVVETTAGAFLGRDWRGINPYWDERRAEFMAKWRACHESPEERS